LEQHFDEVVGMDFSESMLAINPCRRKLKGDATAIPCPDGAFEVVVASHLLHHLPTGQQEQAVREMWRVARRVVVIYEPNRNHPLMAAFGMARAHERLLLSFAPSRPRLLLQAAGLPRVVSRIEGLITPNLCPAFLASAARALGGTGLRRLGFYVRAVGWHAESRLDLSALDA
jgi:SAM-dependent methyltransferase